MDWFVISPELIILGFAALVLAADLVVPARSRWSLAIVAVFGLVGSLVANLALWGQAGTSSFSQMFTVDVTAIVLKSILLVATTLVIVATLKTKHAVSEGEFYSLVLFSVLGAMVMASASDLVLVFLGLELTVMPCYILSGIRRTDPRSSEVALKYFLLGLLASVIMIYGMSFLYGLTGSTTYSGIMAALSSGQVSPLLVIAMLLVVAGLGFKVAAVPFHFWAPDVYEGAPVQAASYFAVGPKAGGFAALLRLFPIALGSAQLGWLGVFAILAVASMIIGNVVALSQIRIRRLLGYSSIAHTGYLLIGLAVASSFAKNALIFYFLVYSAATLGAFLVVLALTQRGFGEGISDFAGLSRRSPYLAVAMAVFLFSLVGLPPLAGFMGKLYLFGSAVQGKMIWLAVIGVLNSVISFGYYSTVIRQMYLVAPTESEPVKAALPVRISIAVLLAAVVVIGFYPSVFLRLIA